MSPSNDAITNHIENFRQVLNAQTNSDKLGKCSIDLQNTRIDPCEGSLAVLPIFAITLIHNNKNYDA
jgi:hypothetical protein